MIKLTDYGKVRLRQLFSPRLMLCLLINIVFCVMAGVVGSFSQYSAQEAVANQVADAAAKSEDGQFTILTNFDFNDSEATRSNYIEVFNISRDWFLSRVTKHSYESYAGFFTCNPDFSEQFSYKARDLYGDAEISLLVSPVNSLILDANGSKYHEIWHLTMMFSKNHVNPNDGYDSSNFCYLPEDGARNLLRSRGIFEPKEEDFQSLIGTTFTVEFENKLLDETSLLEWNIANIVIDSEESEYFESRFGYYLPCYLGLPSFDNFSISVDFGKTAFLGIDYLKNISSLNAGDSKSYSYGFNSDDQFDFSANDLILRYADPQGYSSSISVIVVCSFLVVALFIESILLLKFYSPVSIFICLDVISILAGFGLLQLVSLLLPGFYSFSMGLAVLGLILLTILLVLERILIKTFRIDIHGIQFGYEHIKI